MNLIIFEFNWFKNEFNWIILQRGPLNQIGNSIERLDYIGKISVEFNAIEFLILLAKVNEQKMNMATYKLWN